MATKYLKVCEQNSELRKTNDRLRTDNSRLKRELKEANHLIETLQAEVAELHGKPTPAHPKAWLNCPCETCETYRIYLGSVEEVKPADAEAQA